MEGSLLTYTCQAWHLPVNSCAPATGEQQARLWGMLNPRPWPPRPLVPAHPFPSQAFLICKAPDEDSLCPPHCTRLLCNEQTGASTSQATLQSRQASMSEDILIVTTWGCCWHPVGKGQSCCFTAHNAHPAPITEIQPPKTDHTLVMCSVVSASA